MNEQELKEEFLKEFGRGSYEEIAVKVADYWLSKRQAELSSFRGEIEGEKRLVHGDEATEGWKQYKIDFNEGIDKALSCINKLIETK